jgi:beta-glucosidase
MKQTAERFARYCERAAAALGDLIGTACTLNEPNIVALHGYGTGVFPPGTRDRGARDRANDTFVHAHRLAVDAIRGAVPHAVPVGLTLSMTDYQDAGDGAERLHRIRSKMEDVFLTATAGDDFVGVQTYTRVRVGADGALGPAPGVETTIMGYEFWPEALEATIRRAVDVSALPVIVTENGIAATDDSRRVEYVKRALSGVENCLRDGIDVLGYFYWSALDNFEWVFGYGPTFGLIAVDRETQQRTVKPSAEWLGALARANST